MQATRVQQPIRKPRIVRQYKEPSIFTRAHALVVIGAALVLMLAAALYL